MDCYCHRSHSSHFAPELASEADSCADKSPVEPTWSIQTVNLILYLLSTKSADKHRNPQRHTYIKCNTIALPFTIRFVHVYNRRSGCAHNHNTLVSAAGGAQPKAGMPTGWIRQRIEIIMNSSPNEVVLGDVLRLALPLGHHATCARR